MGQQPLLLNLNHPAPAGQRRGLLNEFRDERLARLSMPSCTRDLRICCLVLVRRAVGRDVDSYRRSFDRLGYAVGLLTTPTERETLAG
jgi:hypothetical protein